MVEDKENKKDEEKEKTQPQTQSETEQVEKDKSNKSFKSISIFLFIIIIILVIIILAFVFKLQIVSLYKEIKGDIFEFQGFKFEKVYIGNLNMYATNLKIVRTNETFSYLLYLRNDPRTNNISAKISNKLMKSAYVSFTDEILKCNDTTMAAWELGSFLNALGIEKKGAFANATHESEGEIATCDNMKYSSVILFKEANETKIYNTNPDCFVIDVANCKNIEAAEKFILAFIEFSQKSRNVSATNTTLNDLK